jgi:GWxTD domain-containing protein
VRGETPEGGSRHARRIPLLALLTASLLTSYFSPLTCQTHPLIAGFQHLRDSLAATSDTAALRTLLRSARHHQKTHREDRSAALWSGLVALRLGELSADPDFSEARSRFREATRQDPSRPEAWFGLGLSEAGRSKWEMSERLNLGSRVGLKALERSADSYRHALAADPTYLPAAPALAGVELSLMDTARLVVAREALRRVARVVVPATPDFLLALGRLERATGALDSASHAFERYLMIGPNRALGLLELARTRLALGRGDGEAPYYEGAAMNDPEATIGFRADLRPLASDSVMWMFDRLSGQARAAYLHRFWTDRDKYELRKEGERLREHYRRLQYARIHFPLTLSRRFYGRLDAYRSGNIELDDRGVMYLRHGEPATRLRPFVFAAMPNESWRYIRAEGDLLLHFSGGWDQNGGGDLYDYRLVESVLDLRGAAEAPKDQLLLSRQSLSPAYARMLNWGTHGAGKARTYERSIGIASIEVSTTTDTYELQFERRLAAVADLIAVGRSARGSLAHLVFGIVATGTSPLVSDSAVQYPVRVRLVALDRQDRAVASLDTTLVEGRVRPLADGEFLVGRAELTLPPGEWTYRVSLEQGDGAGVVLPRQAVRVASPGGLTLSLSDVALGTRGRAVSWITDAADTVLLAPSSIFRKGSDVELYYEISGARPGLVYRHEISVLRPARKGSKRKPPLVALSFDEAAADSVIRSQRVMQLRRLKEGSYVVEVKLTAPDGSSRIRQRPVRIIGR